MLRRLPAAPPLFVPPTLVLIAILAAAVALWWPSAYEFSIGYDDRQLMGVSADLAAGRWTRLLALQDVHVIPLYRLLRLYFDRHFPERFHWMHAAAIAAHLASTVLLFVLSRRFLRTAAAALTVAGLFAWHALSCDALIVKAQNTFVLSLPLLLVAVYCFCRGRDQPGPGSELRWAGGAFLCLLIAVGVHSTLAAAAIPGVLLGYYLLGRKKGGARRDVAAWGACTVPMVIALALASYAGASMPGAGHLSAPSSAPEAVRQIPARCWIGLQAVAFNFSFLVRRAPPSVPFQAGAALALAALIVFLRREASWRWIVTALAIAAGPVFAAFLARGLGVPPGRYLYQSFVLVAVAGGSVVDAVLAAAADRPGIRMAVISALLAAVPVYYVSQKKSIELRLEVLRLNGSMTRDAWIGWKAFLEQAAGRAASSGTSFRLPYVQLGPGISTREVFLGCYPRGRDGIEMLYPGDMHAQDCVTFAAAAREIDRLPLPPTMAIVEPGDPAPQGNALACGVPARHGLPPVVSLQR